MTLIIKLIINGCDQNDHWLGYPPLISAHVGYKALEGFVQDDVLPADPVSRDNLPYVMSRKVSRISDRKVPISLLPCQVITRCLDTSHYFALSKGQQHLPTMRIAALSFHQWLGNPPSSRGCSQSRTTFVWKSCTAAAAPEVPTSSGRRGPGLHARA